MLKENPGASENEGVGVAVAGAGASFEVDASPEGDPKEKLVGAGGVAGFDRMDEVAKKFGMPDLLWSGFASSAASLDLNEKPCGSAACVVVAGAVVVALGAGANEKAEGAGVGSASL